MKHTGPVAGAALLALGGATYSLASPSQPPEETPAVVEAAASRCAFCHGSEGVAPHPIWPSIAGMDADYLKRQLDGFAAGPEGPRRSPHAVQMYSISDWLDADQRTALARHYSAFPAPAWHPPENIELGRVLFTRGQGAVLACASCHGTEAEGNTDLAAPRLAGQSARYIHAQLQAYAAGSRDDGDSGMAVIAAAMTDEQMSAVADYLQKDGRR